jgi:hypothetical protein
VAKFEVSRVEVLKIIVLSWKKKNDFRCSNLTKDELAAFLEASEGDYFEKVDRLYKMYCDKKVDSDRVNFAHWTNHPQHGYNSKK